MKGDRGPWTPDHLSVAALHTLGPRTCGFSLYLLRLARHLKCEDSGRADRVGFDLDKR